MTNTKTVRVTEVADENAPANDLRSQRTAAAAEYQAAQQRKPIEVWLTRRNLAVTCRVVHEDESTDEYDVQSLSMRGAQREMTGYFKREGYEPAGRWITAQAAEVEDGPEETYRRFR